MTRLFIYISIVLFASSCFEPDEVLPKTPEDLVTIELDIESKQIVYLDLDPLSTTNIGSNKNWQLRFQNDLKSWSIYINPFNKAGIHNTKNINFESINSDYFIGSISWDVDIPTESGTYPAIGTWGDYDFSNPKSYKNTYLITWTEDQTDYIYKFQMLDATESAYHIRFGPLNSDESIVKWIPKDSRYTHTYFNLLDVNIFSNLEPSKENWNLCFTYVSDSLKNNTKLPYIASANPYFGLFQAVIVNHDLNHIYLDTSDNFDGIDYFYARDLPYSRTDQLINPFYKWNLRQETIIDNKTTLIVKNADRYFALKPVSVRNVGLKSLEISLRLKQL